jgi:hypothetical protein
MPCTADARFPRMTSRIVKWTWSGALAVSLAGCSSAGDGGGGTGGTGEVSHDVRYEVRFVGGATPAYMLQISYTDMGGRSIQDSTITGTWTKQFSVSYPDVSGLTVSASSVPINTTTLAPQAPTIECVVTVDKHIVDQSKSTVPLCRAELTDSTEPPTTSPR